MHHPLYHYTAIHLPPRPRERPDADTMRVRIDLGLDVEVNTILRLARIDATELHVADGSGFVARDYMRSLWPFGEKALIHTTKRELYSRWITEVWLMDHRNLSDLLVEAGHAVYKTY